MRIDPHRHAVSFMRYYLADNFIDTVERKQHEKHLDCSCGNSLRRSFLRLRDAPNLSQSPTMGL